jgi:hypothetical protein
MKKKVDTAHKTAGGRRLKGVGPTSTQQRTHMKTFAALLLAAANIAVAHAQQPTVTFELPVQGITVEAGPDGRFDRLYATGVAPVDFNDRRGIAAGQRLAELRAKAELIKFLGERMSDETIASELETTSEVSSRTLVGSESRERTLKRTVARTISQILRTRTEGALTGVQVLEAGYDETREEAWVKVGFSRTSIALSSEVRRALNNNSGPVGGAEPQRSVIERQPSEVRVAPPLP